MDCLLCNINEDFLNLFEDPDSKVILHPKGSAPAHMLVVPKIHHTIMEQIPDKQLGQVFRVARLMSNALKHGIAADSFNLLITNGLDQDIPHFSINLIPRGQGDGIDISWQGVQISEKDMDSIQQSITQMLFGSSNETKTEDKAEDIDYDMRRIP